MGRKPGGAEAMSSAERQRRYRERRKCELENLREATARHAAAKAPIERKRTPKDDRQANRIHHNGRISGICAAADFIMTNTPYPGLARKLLESNYIGRAEAEKALGKGNPTLVNLDKCGAWGNQNVT